MTMLKATRFNIRRPDPAAAAAPAPRPRPAPTPASSPAPGEMLFDNHDDGFGNQVFPTAAAASAPAPTAPAPDAQTEAALEAIRKEGLTGRQLRTARRIAQRHNLPATSDYDAVRLLRAAGIDPFQRSSMLELVTPETAVGPAPAPAVTPEPLVGGAPPPPPAGGSRALTPLPGDGVKLPQTIKPIQVPSTEQRAETNHAAEILKMQRDIARRRRKKLMLLMARMFVFVFLPTMIAGWYFSSVATPMYSTKSEFVIQQAEPPQASGMGGLLAGSPMATSQDSIAVQGYLQSREALQRLEADHGFSMHFKGDAVDPITRLPDDATFEDAYKLYGKYVLISYDPTEGIVKMETVAPDPQVAANWARTLIGYAEEQVDQLTQRLREDSMKGARESYEAAEAAVIAAQQRVIELQEKFKVLNSEVELTLLTSQIGALETQLTQEKLSLAQMESNENPNAARMEPVKRRIQALEEEIALLRSKLTEDQAGGESLARIQGELLVAQADVQTRQLLLSQSLQSMENARIEANRQVRYLSLSVSPVPTDAASYPRTFENTAVTMLILLGIYLMVSMTASILREQVSA